MILKVSTVSCASKLNSFILSEFHTCIQCISFISLHTVALPIPCGLMAPRPSLSPWAQPLCVFRSTAGAWGLPHPPQTMSAALICSLQPSCCEPVESMGTVALSGPEDTGSLCCPHLKLTVFLPGLVRSSLSLADDFKDVYHTTVIWGLMIYSISHTHTHEHNCRKQGIKLPFISLECVRAWYHLSEMSPHELLVKGVWKSPQILVVAIALGYPSELDVKTLCLG